jgi:uncharacterized membrane protein YsdA (DUF1294 family)
MDSSQTAKPATVSAQLDPAKVKNYIARLRDAQNLGLGLAGGAVGALIGAVLWAAITAASHFQIGFMAVGVGLLTGYGVRTLGKGIDPIFGYAGAVLSLLGCVAGNILAVMIVVSTQQHIPFAALASHMTPQLAWRMLAADFNVIDVVFYGLGLYYGYRNSFHRISNKELAALS